jgi:predicted nucleic-acid-binding Zn-ribbon protein
VPDRRIKESNSVARAAKRDSAKIDFEKAYAWLTTHWQGDWLCPICGQDDWLVHDEAVEVRAFGQGRLAAKGSIFPLLTVLCSNCGHTLFFNALIAGLVEPPEEV